MLSAEKEKEYLDKLAHCVVHFEEEESKKTAEAALADGLDPAKGVFDGLVRGMDEVGRLYEQQEYFVPELLMCADALYAALDVLKPHIRGEGASKGKMLMGVVQGDIHDIGKNLVKIMFEAGGFEVHDLGKDVALDAFLAEQEKLNPDLIALSAMMTTTMIRMGEIIKGIKRARPEARVMVGGAPLTAEIAKRLGADGYAPNATQAFKEAMRLLGK